MEDTKALTGEAVPRKVSVGDEIISGCINLTNILKIRTTKEYGESTVARMTMHDKSTLQTDDLAGKSERSNQ